MTDHADGVRDAGFDDWLDALAAGEGYHLRCPEGHASLPPRLVCPDCGAGDLSEAPLTTAGELVTYSVVHVGTDEFDGQTPYVVGIAALGDVCLTGLVRGLDPEAVAVGTAVEATVGENPSTGGRVVVLRAD